MYLNLQSLDCMNNKIQFLGIYVCGTILELSLNDKTKLVAWLQVIRADPGCMTGKDVKFHPLTARLHSSDFTSGVTVRRLIRCSLFEQSNSSIYYVTQDSS